jgi:hypothetical protein
MGRYREADLSRLRVGSAAERPTRVSVEQFARPLAPAHAQAVVESLPDLLGGRDLRSLVEAVARARRGGRPVVLMCGAHVVKAGVSPCLLAWLRRGVATHLALNGAAAIHDVEIARLGRTSEDVEAQLGEGRFGMVDETGGFMQAAVADAAARGEGLGECYGRALLAEGPPHLDASLLAEAYRRGVPATVHVAIGTDTIHYHPRCDGAALGAASLRDFRILCATLAEARDAVVLNLGSAVVLPEVFLKALAVARNLGADLSGLVTANLDQIRHYRPLMNVVERPARVAGGQGYQLTGQHEFLVPLLTGAVLGRLGERGPGTAGCGN